MASSAKSDATDSAKPTEGEVSLDQMECVCEVGILIIDDDEMTCRVIRDALSRPGFRIRSVSEANHVDAVIQEHSPLHLVVLDYVLPGLHADQVLGWIQKHQPDAEVIVITGYPTVQGAQTALRARVFDYVTKPFQLNRFRQTVLRCLESRGLLRMSGDALRAAVGTAIRQRRKLLGLTLSDLVQRTGFSLSYLSQIETGKNSAPIETLYRICLALGIRLADLFATLQRP